MNSAPPSAPPPTPHTAGPPAPAQQHVFFATRSPDYRIHTAYFESLIRTMALLGKNGILASIRVLSGGNILKAQNQLLAEFLAGPCTDFFTIDSDLAWDAESALRLLRYDVDVVACDYPLKERDDRWAARTPPRSIPARSKPSFLVHGPDNQLAFDPATGLIEAPVVRGGFQRIRRQALEHMVATYCPEDEPAGGATLRLRDGLVMLFDSTIHDGELADDNSTFCHRWTQLGGKCWLDGGGHFEHVGPASFYAPPLNDQLGISALLASLRGPLKVAPTPGPVTPAAPTPPAEAPPAAP